MSCFNLMKTRHSPPMVWRWRTRRWRRGLPDGPWSRISRSPRSRRCHLRRWDAPTEPTSYTLGPSICLIAQGSKRVLLGEDVYVYDAHHFLITSVDLPVVTQVLEASKEKPYLGLALKLDLRAVAQLMVDSNLPLPRAQPAEPGHGGQRGVAAAT